QRASCPSTFRAGIFASNQTGLLGRKRFTPTSGGANLRTAVAPLTKIGSAAGRLPLSGVVLLKALAASGTRWQGLRTPGAPVTNSDESWPPASSAAFVRVFKAPRAHRSNISSRGVPVGHKQSGDERTAGVLPVGAGLATGFISFALSQLGA